MATPATGPCHLDVRLAVLLLAGCATGAEHTRETPDTLGVSDTLEPPAATFRWALNPIECEDVERRSTVELCVARDGLANEHTVVAYAPLAEGDSKIAVIRYDGPHIGAPLRWQQHLDLGGEPHSAVVTIVRDTAIVAVIAEGACRVVAIDDAGGRILGTQTIVERGARAVQLEGIHDHARIHVRTRDGGVVAVMNPRTTRVLVKRRVDVRAIPEKEIIAVTPAAEQIDDVSVAWERRRLVVKRAKAWTRLLRIVTDEAEKMLHRASLVAIGDRIVVTLHDPEDARVEVQAFDRATGRPLWTSRLTGGSRRAFDTGVVRAEVDGDQLLVHGSGHSFACSIGIADGIERACVDRHIRRLDRTVIDFPDDAIVTP